jgi:hypothetical protein
MRSITVRDFILTMLASLVSPSVESSARWTRLQIPLKAIVDRAQFTDRRHSGADQSRYGGRIFVSQNEV